jgi:gluconolactonase
MTTALPFEILDERFRVCLNRHARLQVLWTGGAWTEGPVYFPALRSLLFSDIPNDRMLRFDECDGHVSVFRQPCGHVNGNTVDREGRLVSCEHSGRRVARTEHDGRLTVVADRYQGKRLNSPNDVVVKSDGSIWFTDPPYGILSDYEGEKAESELGKNHVFRVDRSGTLTSVADDFDRPNGLAFSTDETRLYIADSATPSHLRVFEVRPDGTLRGGGVFAECTAGRFDGLRLDVAGRIFAATDDGVHCYHPDGTLLGKIRTPEVLSNLVFGGARRNRLFMTGANSLYSILLPINGAPTF